MRVEVSGARRDIAIVVGIVVLLGLPHLLLGPSITADDWVWIRNGEFLGWWDAGGERQIGRPGAYLLYAVTFGLVGAHPLVHALVQVALWALAAVAVLLALREVLEHRLALLVTAVWLLAPTHTTLELWASTSQAWVAILCLAAGCRRVARAARGEAAFWPGAVLLGVAGGFYEVAILAAPVCAALVDRSATGRWRWRHAAVVGVACLPALAWSLASATVYTDEVALRTTEGYWLEHLGGSIGFGIPIDDRRVAGAVVLAWVVALAILSRARAGTRELRLALAGTAIVLAGTAAALRAYTIPFGMGDRLTAVSGVGAAMVLVGVARSFTVSRSFGVVAAGAGVVLALVGRAPMLEEWHDVGDEAVAAAEELARREAALVVVNGPIATGRLVYGLSDGWNATAAVQVVTGDAGRVVQVDIGCARSGPPADNPLQQYGTEQGLTVPGCVR